MLGKKDIQKITVGTTGNAETAFPGAGRGQLMVLDNSESVGREDDFYANMWYVKGS